MARFLYWLVVAAGSFFVATGVAYADKIDGTWCSPDGKSMTIEGRRITTPGGNNLIGTYTRHTFTYDVPAGEPDEGSRIWSEQLNDEMIRVTRYRSEEPGEPVIWTRCEVIS